MTRRLITLAALLIGPVIGTGRATGDGVEVTPSNGTFDVPPYAQAQTQVFSVKNTGDRTVDFSIQAADCQPFELNCSWSTFSLNGVAPNQSVPLTVTFTSGAPGWTGTISFVAKVNDNQSVAAGATITVRVPQQAWVETKSLNPGTTIARDHCVAFTVATNAAYECGDLRIAHAAPSLRVRNDDRTPVLLYNSAHAEPRPVVLADVSTPNASSVTGVTATLAVRRGASDVQVASQSIGTLPVASTRRIALSYDASGDTTGIYPYTMTVSMTVDGQPQPPMSTTDTLVVVNRKTSAFGAGWWVAGYERLVPLVGGSFLWIGGDGSTRRYAPDPTTPGVFRTLGLDRPDSLFLQGSTYVRMLRHRAQVQFDLSGRHVATLDPLGIATTFQHDGAGRLQFIIHPTASQPHHTFFYNAGGLLDSLTGPGPTAGTRRITLLHGSGGRVERITDADGISVMFGFGTPTGLVVTSRTNRNGVVQSFGYASNRLVEATIPLNASESAVSTFCPTEIRGLVTGGCGSAPLPPSDAVTTVDGPRPPSDVNDLTSLKIDRFGEPQVMTDPIGNTVRFYRGNRSMPALVTRVVNRNGWVNDAFYNANGLVGARVEYGPLGGGGIATRCVKVAWPFGFSAFKQKTFRSISWHGSLLEDNRDATGLLYKRNRYLDPNTGQFMQEDPIGLAGGMNLYGFAGGDPVNYSDPFGLATCPPVCGDVFSDLARRLAPLENALNAVGEVTGVNDLGRAGGDIAGGHPIRGGISIAMALPGVGAEGRLGVKAARYADDFAIAFHHAWPKYLGGVDQQLLEVLPRELHNAYHSGLDKILPRQAGGGYYQNLSRAQLRQVYRDFEAYTRAFDREYGTRLWEAARREGFR